MLCCVYVVLYNVVLCYVVFCICCAGVYPVAEYCWVQRIINLSLGDVFVFLTAGREAAAAPQHQPAQHNIVDSGDIHLSSPHQGGAVQLLLLMCTNCVFGIIKGDQEIQKQKFSESFYHPISSRETI